MNKQKTNLKDRIILVDANQADATAAGLRQHFQIMLAHEIPPADLASWLACCALDAGWQTEKGQVQVVFVRKNDTHSLKNFIPKLLDKQIDGQAFQHPTLGEFLLSVVSEEDINSGEPLFLQCVHALTQDTESHHMVLVPDMTRYGQELLHALAQAQNCTTTLLTMQPVQGKGFTHQISGFGLIHAMGIDPGEMN